jgi:DNA excision repair protein ERCC-5
LARGAVTAQPEEEVLPDENGLVYVDELQMNQQERQQTRKFRKKDQYHLPDLDVSMSDMGGPNDPRVMSLEDLQSYARHFQEGEDINVYDFSKIDYDSPFFISLPASDRYNILNAARLRSRLRMGHSKEQLDSMFPDRMAFSKFQIDRVRERNELTQRLMNLNSFENTEFGGGRIAGEKGREYVLVKNDGVEGGWALGVISDEGKQEKPIDLEKPKRIRDEDDEWEEDDDFEDVPIEGLNRLPKQKTGNEQAVDALTKQRRALYQSRRGSTKRVPRRKPKPDQDPESLFVQSSGEEDDEWEDYDGNDDLFGEDENTDDEDLRKALAMSMQTEDHTEEPAEPEDDDDDMLEVFNQSAVEEARPLPKGSGRSIANIVNKRAFNVAPDSREITSFGVPTQKPDSSEDEDTMDLQMALAQSRRPKRKASPPRRETPIGREEQSASNIAKNAGFSGPLPFEKLDLGNSLLGKKKMQQRREETAGGFHNPELEEKQKKKAEPIPPWFSGDIQKDLQAQKDIEAADRQRARDFSKQFQFQDRDDLTFRRSVPGEIIDLDAEDDDGGSEDREIVDLEADSESGLIFQTNESKMDKVANELRASPLLSAKSPETCEKVPASTPAPITEQAREVVSQTGSGTTHGPFAVESDEEIEWSDSDVEKDAQAGTKLRAQSPPKMEGTGSTMTDVFGSSSKKAEINEQPAQPGPSRSPSVDFEDVDLVTEQDTSQQPQRSPSASFEDVQIEQLPGVDVDMTSPPIHTTNLSVDAQENLPEDDEFDDFSDPEDAEMLRSLAIEAEEHARFASTLNNKPQAQNVADYEQELKQLRNQQKKDRRDADEVTQTMILECQALLRLFGLPYVTAPMEAEAQCAELVRLGLVDGIVTDDSDCFLFGGTRIYKNMFNQAKFVECYLTSDLEKEFDLTREKLIAVAHLLGSDYTEGVPHVGPVTALEILSEFGNLEDFKEWWTAVQMNQIPKEDDAKNPFRRKFRRNATKLFLPPVFPDQRVEMAYTNPEVDSDPQAFQWGVPDLDALRSFLMATIGWSQERTDEVLVPVIKDMNRRLDEGTQSNITAFFDGGVGIGAAGINAQGEAFAPRKRVDPSKRMGSALSRMAQRAKGRTAGSTDDPGPGEAVDDGAGDASAAPSREARKGATKSAKRKAKDAGPRSAEGSEDAGSADDEQPVAKKTKRKGGPVAKRGGRKTRS